MQRSEWKRDIRRAFFVFALVFVVRPVVNGQKYSEVTGASGGAFELQDPTLPEAPPLGVASPRPLWSLSDVSRSMYPHSEESQRMPNWDGEAFIQTRPEAPVDKNVKWRIANQESLLFTGIMTPSIFGLRLELATRLTATGSSSTCNR